MSAESKQELKFPTDLSPNRYIVLDFYKADKVGAIGKSITTMLKNGVTQLSQGSILGTVTAIGTGAIETTGLLFNTVANEVTGRVSGNSEAGYNIDLATAEITKNKDTYVDSIYLPLTNNLGEELAHNYDQSNGAISSLLEMSGAASTTNKAVGAISAFTGSRSLLLNPDLVQMYKGTGLRKLSLSWTLMPDSKEEAQIIFEIVRRFKEYSSPELQAGNALLLSPLFCSVTFTNQILNESIRTSDMVINSVLLNYSESGFMETFADGVPKSIVLNVEMGERTMRTREDWYPTAKTYSELADTYATTPKGTSSRTYSLAERNQQIKSKSKG